MSAVHHCLLQNIRHHLQAAVSLNMPVGIVQLLKAVDVQNADRNPLTARIPYDMHRLTLKRIAVPQPGQCIRHRHSLHALALRLFFPQLDLDVDRCGAVLRIDRFLALIQIRMCHTQFHIALFVPHSLIVVHPQFRQKQLEKDGILIDRIGLDRRYGLLPVFILFHVAEQLTQILHIVQIIRRIAVFFTARQKVLHVLIHIVPLSHLPEQPTFEDQYRIIIHLLHFLVKLPLCLL